MQTRVYTPAMQGTGEFDGGKIREQKPIGFSGEGSVVKRVGPLYYWAWATSETEAAIGLHPHKGFEIMTYVTQGHAFHGDTLGTESTVGAGGVQVMQTGSGVSHREKLSAGAELFQIWFEPEFREAARREPTYRQHEHKDFPEIAHADGYSAKTVIGQDAPVQLVTDVGMWDVEIGEGARYRHPVKAGYSVAALVIRGGEGTWREPVSDRQPVPFRHKDFIVAAADSETRMEIVNTGGGSLRLLMIAVPSHVDYPLLPKR